MACSHDGDPSLARTIVDAAARAGADAVQLQIWSLPAMVVARHPQYPDLARLELPHGAWRDLVAYIRDRHPRLGIVACVYETESCDFCEELGVDALKIHSADLSNPALMERVARTGKRIDLSVGASTIEEIRLAVERVNRASASPIWLMNGVQVFPTPPVEARLSYTLLLGRLFGLPVGYQDHSDAESGAAFWLPAAAVGMGVDVIEKHLTHDRSKKGADHQSALDPDEFVRFVAMVREVEAAVGDERPRGFSESEQRYRLYSKKSLVAARDLAAGARVEPGDLIALRAAELGLPPDQASKLVGRTTRRALAAQELVLESDLS